MSTVITESTVYATTVTAPDDADTLNVASIVAPGVGLQPLTDRTNNLVRRCGGANGAGEFQYLDVTGSLDLRVRTRIIGGFLFQPAITSSAAPAVMDSWLATSFAGGGNGHAWSSWAIRAQLWLDLSSHLPAGAVLTKVRALVQPASATAAAGDRMRIVFHRQTPNFGTPAIPAYLGPLHETTSDATFNPQVIDTGVISETIDRTSNLAMQVQASLTGDTNHDDFFAAEITYTDPGPVNL